MVAAKILDVVCKAPSKTRGTSQKLKLGELVCWVVVLGLIYMCSHGLGTRLGVNRTQVLGPDTST